MNMLRQHASTEDDPMSNVFDEMRSALTQARLTMRAADNASTDMAQMLCGRLPTVWNRDTLRDLKRELRKFDMVTGEWKA